MPGFVESKKVEKKEKKKIMWETNSLQNSIAFYKPNLKQIILRFAIMSHTFFFLILHTRDNKSLYVF